MIILYVPKAVHVLIYYFQGLTKSGFQIVKYFPYQKFLRNFLQTRPFKYSSSKNLPAGLSV